MPGSFWFLSMHACSRDCVVSHAVCRKAVCLFVVSYFFELTTWTDCSVFKHLFAVLYFVPGQSLLEAYAGSGGSATWTLGWHSGFAFGSGRVPCACKLCHCRSARNCGTLPASAFDGRGHREPHVVMLALGVMDIRCWCLAGKNWESSRT